MLLLYLKEGILNSGPWKIVEHEFYFILTSKNRGFCHQNHLLEWSKNPSNQPELFVVVSNIFDVYPHPGGKWFIFDLRSFFQKGLVQPQIFKDSIMRILCARNGGIPPGNQHIPSCWAFLRVSSPSNQLAWGYHGLSFTSRLGYPPKWWAHSEDATRA